MIDKLGPYLLGPTDDENQGVYTGDARGLAQLVPDESVDLIFTDPPYSKKFIDLYGWVAEMASQKLRPHGSLFALSGQYWLMQVLDLVRPHLDYHWMGCLYHPTVTHSLRCFPKRVDNYWKPILWFTKSKYNGPFVADGINTGVPDKRFHRWGQGERWVFQFIERIPKESIIFDPFCGGGTVPAVCKQLDRRWLAFEIDPDTAALARDRIRNTQPPLPGIFNNDCEQLSFEDKL